MPVIVMNRSELHGCDFPHLVTRLIYYFMHHKSNDPPVHIAGTTIHTLIHTMLVHLQPDPPGDCPLILTMVPQNAHKLVLTPGFAQQLSAKLHKTPGWMKTLSVSTNTAVILLIKCMITMHRSHR